MLVTLLDFLSGSCLICGSSIGPNPISCDLCICTKVSLIPLSSRSNSNLRFHILSNNTKIIFSVAALPVRSHWNTNVWERSSSDAPSWVCTLFELYYSSLSSKASWCYLVHCVFIQFASYVQIRESAQIVRFALRITILESRRIFVTMHPWWISW